MADNCLFVQVVVAQREDEPDDDDQEGPLLVQGGDEVANFDLIRFEQFLHLIPKAVFK